ncbi:MAG: cytochrome-c oxidase, cbb3-type subunit III [Burkholderiaceae bacterium]|nr:cytochrome-c oxidase, cbb3-type subunit III [Burkholderiaceae bacterium]
MSDFISPGWSIFVAVATVVSLLACLVLLFGASKRKGGSADDTTGHVWDGDLRELNNPLPRWWMLLFVLTVVFGGVYLVLYPGLGAFAGQFHWSAAAQHAADVQRAQTAIAPLYARFDGMAHQALARDPQAQALAERLFINNCATCHGSDARGSKGFPDLTDDDWLWGGTPERIAETIREGRQGQMPPMAAAVGNSQDVRNVANYVLSLSDGPHNNVAAQLGRSNFVACAACHGAGGKGNALLGAPNLADKIWLHGWGEDTVVRMINEGKLNVMPPHKEWLTESQIRVLAAYVWGLSQPTTSAALTR